jgi:hypothetical protein
MGVPVWARVKCARAAGFRIGVVAVGFTSAAKCYRSVGGWCRGGWGCCLFSRRCCYLLSCWCCWPCCRRWFSAICRRWTVGWTGNSRVILNEFQVSLDPCKNIWPIDSVVKRVPPSGYSKDEPSAAFHVVVIHRPSIVALITYQQYSHF